MDSAQQDNQLPKIEDSSSRSAAPSLSNDTGSASYYQPPSAQVAVEPTAVAPATSRPMGTVPPAPGSSVLGSTENPARPNLPTMGMNSSLPRSGPVPAAVPPTVSNEATANQVQQRMQNANAGAGSGKKRSLLLPILGAILVLAIAAAGAFWWWSNQPQETPPLVQNKPAPQEELPLGEALPEGVTEGITERTDSLSLLPAEEVITEEDPNNAKVFGLICKYEETYPTGSVLFYDTANETVYRTGMPDGENVYEMSIPAGEYLAFFDPAAANLPIFAFTEYVNCGMNPNSCTDHSLAKFTVEAGKEYGQVDLCDPQYNQEGLPAELQYENS